MDKNKCTPFFFHFEGRFNPFNVNPPEGYIEPKNEQTGDPLPNCCTFHKQLRRNVENWFQKFPLCCDGHTKMARKEKWFHKDQYKGLPMKIVKQVSFTEYHIRKVHNNPDWFEHITEFIDYNLESFGSFEIGLDRYTNAIKHVLKDPGLKIPRAKKKKLLLYFDELETPKETIETDFNLLENIYRKWLHEFPFELEIFTHLKPKYEKTFPIVREWGKKNRYTGHQIVRLHTKSTMIEQLEDITLQIITEINSLTLHKKGELNDPLNYELGLLEEKRNLKLKTPYRNDVSTEPGYRKVLKEWFEDEKEFIQELQKILAQAKPEPKKEQVETLSSLITHENSDAITEAIKIQYKNIKGRRLKLLLLAFQELKLLPSERIANKFHKCCEREFDWKIASYQAMNGHKYNERTDNDEINAMKQYIESFIKTK